MMVPLHMHGKKNQRKVLEKNHVALYLTFTVAGVGSGVCVSVVLAGFQSTVV